MKDLLRILIFFNLEFSLKSPLPLVLRGHNPLYLSRQCLNSSQKAHSGYGLALILVFLVSTVMIGASLMMLSGPVSLAYLGSSSQDNLAAKGVASTGMEAVISDIQNKLNSNQTVSSSYTYPTTSVTMPQNPAALGGASSTVGSYSATLTATRGDAFLINVTATVGSASTSLSQLIHINRNAYLLDTISGTTAAYSLRKLRSAYSGAAIRVVRTSDSTEQDIGFTPNGDLDINSLKTFLGNTSMPLDAVSSAAVAYSLRQVRLAYTGSAIRVRRSSDNSEQDIGFSSGGSLNIAALLDFVGSSSGYIKTWYDQSGNGKDASQTTTALQPRIVNAGRLDILSTGMPAVSFNGGQYLYNSAISGTIGGSKLTAFMVGQTNNSSSNNGRFVVLHKTGDAQDSSTTSSTVLFQMNATDGEDPDTLVSPHYGSSGTTYIYWDNQMPVSQLFLSGVSINGSSGESELNNIWETWGSDPFTMGSSLNLVPNYLILGTGRANSSFTTNYLTGALSEVIIYNTNLSYNSSRIPIEANEANYFNIPGGWTSVSAPMPVYGQIKTWYDQSGNGNNLTQSTSLYQPSLIFQDGVSSLSRPTLTFSDQPYLSSTTGFPTNSDYTLSVVGAYNYNSWDNSFIAGTTSGAGDHNLWMDSSSGTPTKPKLWHNGTFTTSNTAMSIYTLYALMGTFVNSSKLGTLYLGNTSVGTGTASSTVSSAGIQLGANAGSNKRLYGDISEAIVFSRVLSTAERTIMYNNQQSYYGSL